MRPSLDSPFYNVTPDHKVGVIEILRGMKQIGASELFLKVGSGLRFKVGGQIKPARGEALQLGQMEHIQETLLGSDESRMLAERRVADRVLEADGARFRLHFAYGHTGGYATIRRIGDDIRPFARLGLPSSVVKQMMGLRAGLFIVCGSTDAGKTVTCTSFIDALNIDKELAILTLEDPIEYIFEDKSSFVLQREVGLHVPTFADGMKSALRENLDVIFVGEMRDNATMEQVLRAAEMGHLVISTLHGDDALGAISRVIGSFAQADQPRIRQSLANVLSGVLYQRLLSTPEGGRAPCVESLWITNAMRTLLRSGEVAKIGTYAGPQSGGIQYRDCLDGLLKAGRITQSAYEGEQSRLRSLG